MTDMDDSHSAKTEQISVNSGDTPYTTYELRVDSLARKYAKNKYRLVDYAQEMYDVRALRRPRRADYRLEGVVCTQEADHPSFMPGDLAPPDRSMDSSDSVLSDNDPSAPYSTLAPPIPKKDEEGARVVLIERLAQFINYLAEKGVMDDTLVNTFDKRHKLQKYVYIAQKLGIRIGYEFDFLENGAFSSDLGIDIYDCDPNGTHLEALNLRTNVSDVFIKMVLGRSTRWLQVATFVLQDREMTTSAEFARDVVQGTIVYDPGLVDSVIKKVRAYMRSLEGTEQ